MILTVSAPTEDFAAVQRDRQFALDPPATNTFIPHATVSFVQETGGVDVHWLEEGARQPGGSAAGKALQDILARASRDVERFRDSSRAHTNLGLALINSDRLEDAAREFETALRLDPKHYVASVNLARVRVIQGEFDMAEGLYTRLQNSNPLDTAPLLSLAFISMRRGNFNNAAAQLREVIGLDPKSLLAHYNLALASLALGKPHDAIAQLRLAATFNVRLPAVHQALAVAYTMSNDFRRATRSFRAALTLDPMMQEAIHGLSTVLLLQGETESSAQLLTKYLEQRPEDFEARELLARAYKEQKRYSAARAQLLQILETLKGEDEKAKFRQARLMNNAGACHAFEGDLQRAERLFATAIQLRPDGDPIPYENLARVYLNGGRVPEAQHLLTTCRERFPEREESARLLALCFEKQGRRDEAIEELRSVIQTGKSSAATYVLLGGLLADRKRDLGEALSVLKDAYELFPQEIGVLNNLAYVHLMRGEIVAARSVLDSVPPKLAPNIYLTCTRGMLQLWEGNISEGMARYLEAEQMARQDGRVTLARIVRQKMHLELARAYARMRDTRLAWREVQKGLRITNGNEAYKDDLETLEKGLQSEQQQPNA